MKHVSVLIALSCLSSLSLACSGGSEPDPAGNTGGSAPTGGTGGTGGAAPTGGASGASGAAGSAGTSACGAAITANAANNYSFSSTLVFPPIGVKPDTEITFDWSAVTTDFLGHPVDPMADIDTVNVMLWKLTQEELQTKLNADTLQQRDLAVIATLYSRKMATSGALFDFTSVGMPITPEQILPFLNTTEYPPDAHSYTVMIASGEELGAGTRMIQGFKLDPTSTNSHVTLTSTSTSLDYTVNMRALQPTPVPAGTDLTIDWNAMTLTALQTEFVPNDITEALVAHYTEPVSELEARFLDLDRFAAQMWRGEIVAGTSATLSSFTNQAAGGGPAFTGIDGTGTWILALICGGCRNPAPWYLTVLTPCTP